MAVLLIKVKPLVREAFKSVLKNGITISGRSFVVHQIREVLDLDPGTLESENYFLYEIFVDQGVFISDIEKDAYARHAQYYLQGIAYGMELVFDKNPEEILGRFGRIANQ